MAKKMARINGGTVINIEWHSDRQSETDKLKDCGEMPAGVGDTYTDGGFYRDGVRLLTPMEELQKEADEEIMQLLDIIEQLATEG